MTRESFVRQPSKHQDNQQPASERKGKYRFAWLIMPFPLRIGMTDVDAELNETAKPSVVKGTDGEGRLL